MMAMALNSHALTQSPQRVHSSSSTSGRSLPTEREFSICGFKKMCAFGSSTSQSRNCTGSLSETAMARFVATVVLPVPPFPLATVILMITTCVTFTCAFTRLCSLKNTKKAKLAKRSYGFLSLQSLRSSLRSLRLCARTLLPLLPRITALLRSLGKKVFRQRSLDASSSTVTRASRRARACQPACLKVIQRLLYRPSCSGVHLDSCCC